MSTRRDVVCWGTSCSISWLNSCLWTKKQTLFFTGTCFPISLGTHQSIKVPLAPSPGLTIIACQHRKQNHNSRGTSFPKSLGIHQSIKTPAQSPGLTLACKHRQHNHPFRGISMPLGRHQSIKAPLPPFSGLTLTCWNRNPKHNFRGTCFCMPLAMLQSTKTPLTPSPGLALACQHRKQNHTFRGTCISVPRYTSVHQGICSIFLFNSHLSGQKAKAQF